MSVMNYVEVLEQLENCDAVVFYGFASVNTTVPVTIKIRKDDQNWKLYVEDIVHHDKSSYELNRGYGTWNPKNFPNVIPGFDVTGIDVKECFFSNNGDLVRHVPKEQHNALTNEMCDDIKKRLDSISIANSH